MKKVILVLVLAMMAFTAKAQLYVGGGVLFTSNFGFDSPVLGLTPEVGYNFNDNMAVGTSLGFAFGSGMFQFSIDPYFRYYFIEWGIARFFGDAHFHFGLESGIAKWGIGIRPGVAFPINDRFSVVAHLIQLGYYRDAFTFDLNYTPFYSFTPKVGVFYSF